MDKIIGRIPYTNPDTGKQMEQIRNEMNLYIQNAINENGNYRLINWDFEGGLQFSA